MSKADVIIIGCGISGSVCALKLLNEGFDVRIIEKSQKIGSHNKTKIDITENLLLEPIIKELKLDFLDKSNKSKWFSKNKIFDFESKVYDLFVKRGDDIDSFDTKLSNKIKNYGIRIEKNTTFKDFNFKNHIINSIDIKTKNQKKEIRAKIFVGADGSNSETFKKLKLNSHIKKNVEIIGYGLITNDLNIPEKVTHVFFDSKLLPSGYFFVAKTSKGLSVASIVSTRKSINKPLKQYFDYILSHNKIIKNILSGRKPLNYFSGSCITGILEKRTYNNYCSVGDAAYVLEPVFGYGVRSAIISGYLAAKEIENNLESDKFDLSNYDVSLKKILLYNENYSYLLRELFNEMNNDNFDFLIESLNYLHKRVHLDDLLNNPKKYIDVFLSLIFKYPVSSSKIGIKLIKNLVSFNI